MADKEDRDSKEPREDDRQAIRALALEPEEGVDDLDQPVESDVRFNMSVFKQLLEGMTDATAKEQAEALNHEAVEKANESAKAADNAAKRAEDTKRAVSKG